MPTLHDPHERAFVLHRLAQSLRWQERHERARLMSRRACAMEARHARSLGVGPWAAQAWVSTAWYALDAGRVGAADGCVRRAREADAGFMGDDEVADLLDAIAEARTGQVQR